MNGAHKYSRVLALHLARRGLAFCQFEAPGALHDWGIKYIAWRARHEATLGVVQHLIQRFAPDAIVIEDVSATGARRSARICALYREIEGIADEHGIDLNAYDWEAVFHVFKARQPRTRHDIAVHVAELLPMIKRRLPPKRRCWLPQDPRQSLYDAAALGLSYYAIHGHAE